MSRPCVFFDRDGIVNEHPVDYYIRSWDEFRVMPGFTDALRVVLKKGYPAVIITNQQGVGKGEYTAGAVDTIHRNLLEELNEQGLNILGVYYCPHLQQDGCDCRKPKPGMILTAAGEHDLDVSTSWMIGDQERDVEAGHAAGCRCIRVAKEVQTAAEYQVDRMEDLPALLEELL